MNNKHHNIALGVFELAVFLRKGAERFPSDRGSAYRSFAVIVVLAMINALLFYVAPSDRMGVRPLGELFFLYSSINFLVAGIFFGVVYFLCRMLEKREYFWSFVAISNYAALAPSLISLPLALTVVYGSHSWEDVYNFMVVLLFYGVALQGFIATCALRLPWEFGAAIGFFGMFTYQALSETALFLWGIS